MLKKQTLHLRVDSKMREEIELAAKRQNRTISNLVQTIVGEWLLSDKNEPVRTYTGKPVKVSPPKDYAE